MALYIIVFNDAGSPREKLVSHFNLRPDMVIDWYYCITNSIFIASNKTPAEIRDFIRTVTGDNRIFLSEITSKSRVDGWMPKTAWDFIGKYITS